MGKSTGKLEAKGYGTKASLAELGGAEDGETAEFAAGGDTPRMSPGGLAGARVVKSEVSCYWKCQPPKYLAKARRHSESKSWLS